MNHISTVADKKYVYKGLTLYDSIYSKNNNIIFHFFCIDNETKNIVERAKLPGVITYCLEDINPEKELLDIKQKQYPYYCWSLASYFTNFLMQKLDIPVTYIDSDIYFHYDINFLYNKIKESDVGMFRHRHIPLTHTHRHEGLYNVGVLFFNNTEKGKKMLWWWKDAVLHKKYPQYATCGDQKYIEVFAQQQGKANIYIDKDIGHGAPWQWQLYDYSKFNDNGNIIWEGEEQKLIFSHFSQFVYREDGYIPSTMHQPYTPPEMYKNNLFLKKIYNNYYNHLKSITKKYTL